MNPLEIFGIIFDRRHIKDVRLWTLTVLFIGFAVYHWQVIKPLKKRQDRQGKRIGIRVDLRAIRACAKSRCGRIGGSAAVGIAEVVAEIGSGARC